MASSVRHEHNGEPAMLLRFLVAAHMPNAGSIIRHGCQEVVCVVSVYWKIDMNKKWKHEKVVTT